MKYYLCYIDCEERLKFYKKIDSSLKEFKDSQIIAITPSITLCRLAKKNNIECFTLQRNKVLVDALSLKLSYEYLSEELNILQCKNLYSSIFLTINNICSKRKIEGIFSWGDSFLHSFALKEVAARYKMPILFLEIGNFKGKLFADKLGVNANSSIAINPDKLFDYKFKSRYENWLTQFLKYRRCLSNIPQANKAEKLSKVFTKFFSFVRDGVYVFFNSKTAFRKSIFKKVKDLYLFNRYKKRVIKCEKKIYPDNFVFFPMQLSKDTNILINGKINNIKALDIAKKYAKKNNLTLVTKLHPAENNYKFLKDLIFFLKTSDNIILCNENAFILSERAKHIITINSTVGLESKIIHKNVEILGNAMFKNWTEEHIKHYIMSFLIDISYFDAKGISKESLNNLINRFNK